MPAAQWSSWWGSDTELVDGLQPLTYFLVTVTITNVLDFRVIKAFRSLSVVDKFDSSDYDDTIQYATHARFTVEEELASSLQAMTAPAVTDSPQRNQRTLEPMGCQPLVSAM